MYLTVMLYKMCSMEDRRWGHLYDNVEGLEIEMHDVTGLKVNCSQQDGNSAGR